MRIPTPSQTVGPFFAYGLTPGQYGYDFPQWADHKMIDPLEFEDTITIIGTVYDGNNDPIPDAMIELWQVDGDRKLFGRFGTGTDPENRFIFHTVKPKPTGMNAPFITLLLFMRGQLIHSYTRIYFDDEFVLNAQDPLLQIIPESRRHTLIARKQATKYIFDIYMQGPDETVFFAICQ